MPTLQRVLVPKFRHNVLLNSHRSVQRRHAEGECNLKFELSINEKGNDRARGGRTAGRRERWSEERVNPTRGERERERGEIIFPSSFWRGPERDEEFGRGITQLASFPPSPLSPSPPCRSFLPSPRFSFSQSSFPPCLPLPSPFLLLRLALRLLVISIPSCNLSRRLGW